MRSLHFDRVVLKLCHRSVIQRIRHWPANCTLNEMLVPKEKFLFWLTVAFFATLFLPPEMPVINNILIGAIFTVCLVFNPPAEKWLFLRNRRAVLFMLLFFILQLISAATSADHARAWSILAMRSPLLIFPLALGGIYVNSRIKSRMLFAYAVIVLVVSVCCGADAVRRSWVHHDMQWLYDDSLTKAIGRSSVYMAQIVVIAIFCFVWLLHKGIIKGRTRLLAGFGTIFLVLFHFLLASRTSLFVLYIAAIGYVFHLMTRGFRSAMWLIGSGLLVSITLFFTFPKTMNRMRQLEYLHFDYQSRGLESHYNMAVDSSQWNGANFRLAAWSCGWRVARQHLLAGVPLGDKQTILRQEYKARDFMFAYVRNRNLHNTWLDVLVNTGIAGSAIFLLAYLVLPVWITIRQGDWLGLAIVGAFAAALSTENWIDSSFGSVLLGFWLSLVSAWQTLPAARKATLPREEPAVHCP
ncbi:MAG: hypothetical protein C5B59_05300 [Bacteroidetes bacterium]|nr:MAG: hypothetical protein C5B59_05300 [Bacteroidota bacterium]